MTRRAVPVATLLARAKATAISVQAASLQRREAVLDEATGHAAWMPLLAELCLAFDGTSRGGGAMLQITPGRPFFAWLMPSRVHRFEIVCDASDGWSPRLYIDGVAADATG
jgi:hypothetical protein